MRKILFIGFILFILLIIGIVIAYDTVYNPYTGKFDYVLDNDTVQGYSNTSLINCLRITGGSDGDYCSDATGAGGSSKDNYWGKYSGYLSPNATSGVSRRVNVSTINTTNITTKNLLATNLVELSPNAKIILGYMDVDKYIMYNSTRDIIQYQVDAGAKHEFIGTVNITGTLVLEDYPAWDINSGDDWNKTTAVGGDVSGTAGAVLIRTISQGLSGGNITAGTVADARIAATIARDTELSNNSIIRNNTRKTFYNISGICFKWVNVTARDSYAC